METPRPYSMRQPLVLWFETGILRGDNFSYGEIWHTERDLYNKMIPDYQKHSSVVTAVVAYGVANLDHLLSREGYYLPKKEEPPKK